MKIFLYTFIGAATGDLHLGGPNRNCLRLIVTGHLCLQRQTRIETAVISGNIYMFIIDGEPTLFLVNTLHGHRYLLSVKFETTVIPTPLVTAAGLAS
jgi:hypothetical protein